MAGAKVPAPLDPMGTAASWTNILARLEKTYKGYDGISLTNWSSASTDRPQIAAGSVIEIDGAPFEYATDDTIADEGGLTDGWCYVKHVVSGDTVTATLTNTFGTWDTAKQGFYDGSGNRFSLFAMYRSGAITKIFTLKANIIKSPNSNASYHLLYLDGNFGKKKRVKHVFSSSTEATLFNAMSPDIPKIGDQILVNGQWNTANDYNGTLDNYSMVHGNVVYAERASSTAITLYIYEQSWRWTADTAETDLYSIFTSFPPGYQVNIASGDGTAIGTSIGLSTDLRPASQQIFVISWESTSS